MWDEKCAPSFNSVELKSVSVVSIELELIGREGSIASMFSIDAIEVFAVSFVAKKMCLAELFQNVCMYQDKSLRESISASVKSASLAKLMYVFTRWVEPSNSCLKVLCTLSFRDCKAALFSVDAKLFRKLDDDFLNEPALSESCNSGHTPLRNSNGVSYSRLNIVS